MERRLTLLSVLVLHLGAAVVHGATHALVPVALPAWQNGLVLLTVFVGPVVGVALAVRGHPAGVPIFALSMLGALLLGISLHFLVENPDNVHAVPADPWRLPFQASATGVAVVQALGVLVGVRYWRAR